MGEWSKKIGEYGENVAEKFFSVIGWNDMRSGVEIRCMNTEGKHLNDNGQQSITHGIDYLFSYDSPLVDGHINNIIISVKYKTVKYPNSPTKLFKEFMEDLIRQLECFEYSEAKNSLVLDRYCNVINDIGILFWLNNQKDSNDDLINIVSSARIDYNGEKTIYIMDNKRVAFILDVMKFIKTKTDLYDYFFFYPSTGQNINPISRDNSGKIMPIEYINSNIIPIKLQKKDNPRENCLFLGVLDDFEEDTFLRTMGLAKEISSTFAGQTLIAFHDYNELSHKEIVANAKMRFQESGYAKTVSVLNFNDSLNVF